MKGILLTVSLSLVFTLAACGQDEDLVKETPVEETQNDTTESIEPEESVTEDNPIEKKALIAEDVFFEQFDGTIDHIHGLGYVGNQNVPFFATHDGLKVYENGQWYKTKKENNDYMGFNATEEGFYSSGHPGVDSSLPNPFGIKKSVDNGESLEDLALEGEVDFHLMGVGYYNKVILVQSPHESSKMEANKFYISEDDAKSWQEVQAKGLDDELIVISVHPRNESYMAAAGTRGIYLSKDKGETFELITEGKQGTTVFFTEDDLVYGTYTDSAKLTKLSLNGQSKEEISLPEMPKDAVLYFAANPQKNQEMTFVTFNGYIYHTIDGSDNWTLLVENGKIK